MSATTKTDRRIVKVQLSRNSSDGKSYVLIYDHGGDWQWMGPAPKEIVKLLDCKTKAFFWAELEGTEIVLDNTAPWQEW